MSKTNPKNNIRKVFTDPRYFIGFGFGSGLLPKAPGTWGTLITIPLVFMLSYTPLYVYSLATLLLFILGAIASDQISREIGIHDFGGVNIDEVVGFLLVMLPFPCNWQYLFVGFILFRIFDILKPFPIGWVDKHIHGGFGMMFDDVIASLMTVLVMLLIQYGGFFS
ncbi:MAG: phosphatidylglycerophosphatase A [Gammaproteobacteria bacterium]|nr:phosphatidylglycerophosphatase A [Gammaproteobacteria bacterium]